MITLPIAEIIKDEVAVLPTEGSHFVEEEWVQHRRLADSLKCFKGLFDFVEWPFGSTYKYNWLIAWVWFEWEHSHRLWESMWSWVGRWGWLSYWLFIWSVHFPSIVNNFNIWLMEIMIYFLLKESACETAVGDAAVGAFGLMGWFDEFNV